MSELARSDRLWREDAERHGWRLSPTAWPLRLWGVRHIRHCWHAWWLARHVDAMRSVGLGIGPNQRDLWVLYAIECRQRKDRR